MVEALTIVLAVGVTRGWRSALIGVGAALLALAALVGRARPVARDVPIDDAAVIVGACCWSSGCSGCARRSCARAATSRCTTRRRSTPSSARRRAARRATSAPASTGTRSPCRSRASSSRGSRSPSSSSPSARAADARRRAGRRPRAAALLVVVRRGVARARAAQPRAREHAEVRRRPDADDVRDLLGRRGRRRRRGRATTQRCSRSSPSWRSPRSSRVAPALRDASRAPAGARRHDPARRFARFWYDFIVGDDWRVAVGVVAGSP